MDPRVLELPRKTSENPSEVKHLCPFGCMDGKVDENGYCRHLVGYTDDRKTVELRTKRVSARTGNVHEQTGILTRAAQPGDKLIGTCPGRLNKNRQHTPPTSFRVYRQDGRAPVPITEKQLADVHAQRRSPADVDVFEPDAELAEA